MLTYNDLSPKQKQTIDRMVEYDQSLMTATTINRSLIWKIFTDLKDTPMKIGFPVFLTKKNAISRGLYSWPNPAGIVSSETVDISEPTVYNESEVEPVQPNQLNEYLDSEIKEFYQEAVAAGVNIPYE